MATRDTREEAQELKEKFQKRYPNRTFVIVEDKQRRRTDPNWQIAKKATAVVVDDTPDERGHIEVEVTFFDVVEERVCRSCGKTWQTSAIAEGSNHCGCSSRRAINHTDDYEPFVSEWELRSQGRRSE